jgi:ribosomal protein RSM22 (predicted rRNA methylase)
MLLMEPGTPKGFAFIRQLRGELLEAGAHVTAPCPAGMPCPMNQTDWCHFAARVERSSLHRRIKQGALGYEDEKFSYIAVAREPAILPPARIIRHPQQQPGLITLETCTPEGLRTEQVIKRNKDRFRAARRAGWGAEWR